MPVPALPAPGADLSASLASGFERATPILNSARRSSIPRIVRADGKLITLDGDGSLMLAHPSAFRPLVSPTAT